MKIFHYTTIESLAYILNSRSIKFNRLDQLDDLTESEEFSFFNPLKYIFSSSYTYDEMENIALWKMYANMETGVRLEFDSTNMFEPKQKELPSHSIKGDMPKSIRTALKTADIVSDDYLLIHWIRTEHKNLGDDGILLKKVQYINDIKDKYKSLLLRNPITNAIEFNPWEFGFYKSKYWEFQKEVRILIYTTPNCHSEKDFELLVSNKRKLSTTSIYVPLSDFALNHLKIVLSPKVTEASRIIVNSLTQNLSHVKIQDSALYQTIR